MVELKCRNTVKARAAPWEDSKVARLVSNRAQICEYALKNIAGPSWEGSKVARLATNFEQGALTS